MIFCTKCGGLINNSYLPDHEGKWCTCNNKKNKHIENSENSEKSANSEIIKLLNEILAEIKGIKN